MDEQDLILLKRMECINSIPFFPPGQKVLVELSNKKYYIGELQKPRSDNIYKDKLPIPKNESIELKNAFYCGDERFKSTECIEKDDIISIKAYEPENDKNRFFFILNLLSVTPIPTPISFPISLYESKHNNQDEKNEPKSEPELQNSQGIQLDDLTPIEKLIKNAIYIRNKNRIFYDSIKDIKEQESIAINIESYNMNLKKKPSVITVFTAERIYIFDIMYLGKKSKKKFDEIFKSRKPIKIVQDICQIIHDFEFKKNKVKSVFDIRSVSGVLGKHLDLLNVIDRINKFVIGPKSLLYNDKNVNWNKRPLDDNCKTITVKKVILFKLITRRLREEYHKFIKIFEDISKLEKGKLKGFADLESDENIDNSDSVLDVLNQILELKLN